MRRDRPSDKDGWTELPAEGFRGIIPDWPLSRRIRTSPDDDLAFAEDVATQEEAHWNAAWRTPQAVAWARLGWTQDVALYVRWLAMAELGDMRAASEARQWSDRLGLNPAAMMRNRWRIVRDQVSEKRESAKSASAAAGADMRDRLKALDGGGA